MASTLSRYVDFESISPVKLLFDCHTFDAGPQGTTTFLAGLLNALPAAARRRGQQLEVTCAAADPIAIARFLNIPYLYAPITKGFALRNMRDLPRLTDRPGYDAVISQYVRPFRSSVPCVSVIHDVLFLDFPELFGWRYRAVRRLLFGWAAKRSAAVITVSAYSRERIAHHFAMDPSRIDILPNALDVTSRSLDTNAPPDDPAAPLRLLYVSRFETRKRQHWCVAAACALAAAGRQVELTLVGHAGGSYADEVRAAISDVPPAISISIRSDVSAAELDALYRNTDLFLFPSRCEGFGIPVIEAAAYGLPCVVADNTAMIELRAHYAGIGVPEADEPAFVHAVCEAVAGLRTLRREAVALAPRTQATYQWSNVADGFLDTLQRSGIVA